MQFSQATANVGGWMCRRFMRVDENSVSEYEALANANSRNLARAQCSKWRTHRWHSWPALGRKPSGPALAASRYIVSSRPGAPRSAATILVPSIPDAAQPQHAPDFLHGLPIQASPRSRL